MYRRAQLTWRGARYAWQAVLYDSALSADAGETLRALEPPRRKTGRSGSGGDPLVPLLPTRVEVKVLDVGRRLLNAMETRPDTDFRFELRRDGELYFRGVAGIEASERERAKPTPVVTLVAYDGLTLLKSGAFAPPSSARSVARWLYDLLAKGPLMQGLHTYSRWEAVGQASGNALQGLFAHGEALTPPARRGSSAEGQAPWDALQMLCRLFGLQLGSMRGAWTAVQRSYRLQDPLLDAPEGGAPAEDRPLRVTLTDADLIRSGGPAQGRTSPPPLAPAEHVEARWELSQTPLRNGKFDSDQHPLYGWDASGVTVIRSDDDVSIRLDAASDQLVQRFNAPLAQGVKIIASGAVGVNSGSGIAGRVQLRFFDVVSGTTYSADDFGSWEAGTDAYCLVFSSSYSDGAQSQEVSPLPGSGIGYFEVETIFYPNGTEGNDDFSHLDVGQLTFEPQAEGYASATYSTGTSGDSQREVRLETTLGGLDDHNALAGALRLNTGGDPAEDFDAGASGRQPFLAEWVRDVSGQQQQRLLQFDEWLAPDAPDVPALASIDYDGVLYAPVYVDEVIGRNVRRVVAHEVRSDAVGDVQVVWEPVNEAEEPEATGAPVAEFSASVSGKEVSLDAEASYDENGTRLMLARR